MNFGLLRSYVQAGIISGDASFDWGAIAARLTELGSEAPVADGTTRGGGSRSVESATGRMDNDWAPQNPLLFGISAC